MEESTIKGILLVKFDEEKGYIPVKVLPAKIRKRANLDLFKEIARNAIGFGTQVEFQAFTLSDNSSEVHCLAKRFSIAVSDARGGSELYALVMVGETEEFPKELLGEATQKIINDWEARSDIMNALNDAFNPSRETSFPFSAPKETSSEGRTLIPKELFTEKEGFFADGITITRNLLMLLAVVIIFWVLYLQYNLYSFSFLLTMGIFVFTIVSKKDLPLKIMNGFLFFFIILLFVKLFFELIGDPSSLAFLGTFPDFTPHLAILSFLSGVLICLGLDRGVAVDKASFIIGICGAVILVLLFFTPLLDIIIAFFEGT